MMEHKIAEALKKEPHQYVRNALVLLTLAVLVALCLPYITYKGLIKGGLQVPLNILSSFFNLDTKVLFDFKTSGGVPYLLLETVAIAFLGTVLGVLLSMPLAFLSARNIVSGPFSVIGVTLITTIRTIPPVIYAVMFVSIRPGPLAGVLTFAITSIGMVSKMFIEAIEELDKGVIEALDSSGANRLQKVRYGILPQMMSNLLSIVLYRFEINVKNAAILGLVGAGGIGFELITAMGNHRWKDACTLLTGLIVLVLVIEYFSTRLRSRLAKGE